MDTLNPKVLFVASSTPANQVLIEQISILNFFQY